MNLTRGHLFHWLADHRQMHQLGNGISFVDAYRFECVVDDLYHDLPLVSGIDDARPYQVVITSLGAYFEHGSRWNLDSDTGVNIAVRKWPENCILKRIDIYTGVCGVLADGKNSILDQPGNFQ